MFDINVKKRSTRNGHPCWFLRTFRRDTKQRVLKGPFQWEDPDGRSQNVDEGNGHGWVSGGGGGPVTVWWHILTGSRVLLFQESPVVEVPVLWRRGEVPRSVTRTFFYVKMIFFFRIQSIKPLPTFFKSFFPKRMIFLKTCDVRPPFYFQIHCGCRHTDVGCKGEDRMRGWV